MTIAIDPEIDHLTLINRDKDGNKRVVLKVDADLSEAREKTYKAIVIQRGSGGAESVEEKGPDL